MLQIKLEDAIAMGIVEINKRYNQREISYNMAQDYAYNVILDLTSKKAFVNQSLIFDTNIIDKYKDLYESVDNSFLDNEPGVKLKDDMNIDKLYNTFICNLPYNVFLTYKNDDIISKCLCYRNSSRRKKYEQK